MNLTTNLIVNVNDIQPEDKKRLWHAIDLSKKCIPIDNAFSVGALVYDKSNNLISTGYSREVGERSHAEEVALLKAHEQEINLEGGTIYCSLEPCGKRSSSNKTCTQRIIEAGITKVVFALREPHLFVLPASIERFSRAGIQVVHVSEYESAVKEINKHLI